MSVIGRLDEQVDAVLIAPLVRRDEEVPNADPAQSHQNIARRGLATQTAGESRPQKSAPANREEFPVWLL